MAEAAVEDRRQSGLWQQNPSTGYYEKQPTSGPFKYYQPPPRTSATDRRSFADRATGLPSGFPSGVDDDDADGYDSYGGGDAYATAAANATRSLSTRRGVQDTGRSLVQDRAQDVALATHEKILQSPEHLDLVDKLHALGGDADAQHFATKSHHSTTLPAQTTNSRGLDEAAGGAEMNPISMAEQMGSAGPEHLAQTRHINDGAPRPGLTIDPNVAPANLRTKPWSPTTATTSGPADANRRSSVPDRSPLQKLEREMSKEEKRTRLEEAENRAMQRQGTLRHEKGRAVSDGSTRPLESSSDKFYQHSPRQVSSGSARQDGFAGNERFQRASEELRRGVPAIANEPRPYRHAPDAPRSLDANRRRDVDRSYEIPSSFGGTPPIAKEARPYHHAPAVPRSLDSTRRSMDEQQQRGLETGGPAIASEARPYRHAPEVPTSVNAAQYPHNMPGASGDQQRRSLDESRGTTASGGMDRSGSGRYYHRLRDAGFIGAAGAATVGAGALTYEQAKGKSDDVLYEPRQSGEAQRSASKKLQKTRTNDENRGIRDSFSPPSQTQTQNQNDDVARSISTKSIGRSGSKKLQKKSGPPQGRTSLDNTPSRDADPNVGRQALQTDRMGGGLAGSMSDRKAAEANQQPDPVHRDSVKTGPNTGVPFEIPPQTAAGQEAKEQVGFDKARLGGAAAAGAVVGAGAIGAGAVASQNQGEGEHHRFGGMFHHRDENAEPRSYQASKPLEEWRGVAPVRLTRADLEFERGATSAGGDSAWWEKNRGSQRSSGSRAVGAAQLDGPYEEQAKLFDPPMFLKCGPLLRYTGIRRDGEREIWRGSVMIVTEDEQSDTSTAPTLRLFAQPMELLPPPPRHMIDSGQELPSEYEDPVAGQVKMSRTGRPLYVRPVHDIPGGVDLSKEENNQGLYSATKTPVLGQQTSVGPDGKESQYSSFQDKSRVKARDGERAGRYKEIRAVRLHAERGFTFWRWSIEIELGSQQHRIAYRINRGPALGFWVPPRGETMNVMFHSCNGFSLSVDSNNFSGPDPLWRDVLNKHQFRPFHVMIGGGDQIYNDAAMRDTKLFKEWLQMKSPDWKHGADFSADMQDELEDFYLNRYSMWFSQGLFGMAGSQIPMVNIWDDHDIIDGYGSYPHHFMATKVFAGLGAIAFKYYMLFQHQSLVAETAREEPSWVLGASPGPYINELSRNLFLDLGRKVKFLGVDCRTERMRDEVLSERTYDILLHRCRDGIQSGETKHLIVLLGVPIAYPRLNFLENILTSRVMDPIKAIGRTGMLGGFVNKFDGGVEILDDLDDHWTAKHHKAERNWFIQELQQLAAEKSVRVTILGGDVHLGAVGQFYTPKKFGVAKDRDHRYIPNVISSAIVNTPPPTMMADVLNKRNKVHHLDSETDENLIPMFEVDVDGSKRNNKCLLPRRNYATIREFMPGHTPPPSPPPERTVQFAPEDEEVPDDRDRRFPPSSLARRTMSLTRGPGNLMRRLSGSRNSSRDAFGPPDQQTSGVDRSSSTGGGRPDAATNGTTDQEFRRPSFHRRPTDLNEKAIRKAAAKGGAPDEEGAETAPEPGHINLEGGLDITLNMEIDQQDPVGATQAYRLLVPALWYSGAPDVNTAQFKSKRGGTILNRFRGRKKQPDEEYSRSPSQSPPPDGQMQRSAVTGEPVGGPVQAPRANYGADGNYSDNRNGASQGLVVDQRAVGYGKGYNLQPPLGNGQQASAPAAQQTTYNNPYPPQPGYQNTSMPISQKHTQQVPYDQEGDEDEYSEGSVMSDEYYDARDRQPRRSNKVQRFFGIGNKDSAMDDDGGGYIDGAAAPEKKKANWKIWK